MSTEVSTEQDSFLSGSGSLLYVRSICVGVYALLMFPVLALATQNRIPTFESSQDYELYSYASTAPILGAGAASLLMALIMLVFATRVLTNFRKLWGLHFAQVPMMLFAVAAMLGAVFANALNSFIYVALFALYYVSFLLFWNLPKAAVDKTIKAVLFTVVGFSFIWTAIFFPPQGRWLGGIHPNNLGQVQTVMVVLALFYSRGWFRTAIVFLALLVSISVSSRFAILASSAATAYCISIWLRRYCSNGVIITLWVLAGIGALMISFETSLFNDVFLLNDRQRGIDSGISGRDQLWEAFLPQIEQVPLTGFGFRNRGAFYNAHNGYLNIILETGVVAGILIIATFVGTAIRLLQLAARGEADRNQQFAGALLAVLALSVLFQPQFLNFADIGGVSFFLAISVPRLARGITPAAAAAAKARAEAPPLGAVRLRPS